MTLYACSLCPDKKYKYKKWLYTHLTNIHKELEQNNFDSFILTIIEQKTGVEDHQQVVINNIPISNTKKQSDSCCQHCYEYRSSVDKLSKQIDDLSKQIKVIEGLKSEKNLCIACWEYESTFALQPCGHKLLCGTCAAIMLATNPYCPLCRTKVVDILQIWDTSVSENIVT